MRRRRGGFTLVELLVVIALLTLVTGLSGVAMLRVRPDPATGWRGDVESLRRAAIRDGRASTKPVRRDDRTFVVTALADGRLVADSALHVDTATGEVRDAQR